MSEDNILYIVRLICLIFAIFVLFYNEKVNNKITEPIIQIIIALIIMVVFVFIDPLSGFFIACAIFIIYYKLYTNLNDKTLKSNNYISDNILSYDYKKKELPYGNYITEQHLEKAQSNIISDTTDDIIPFDMNKIKLFGVQGLNNLIKGYEKTLYQIY